MQLRRAATSGAGGLGDVALVVFLFADPRKRLDDSSEFWGQGVQAFLAGRANRGGHGAASNWPHQSVALTSGHFASARAPWCR